MTVADGYSSAKSLQTLACSKGLTGGRVKMKGQEASTLPRFLYQSQYRGPVEDQI